MAFVVTENCIRCKYTDCVEVCPVDCFHEGENMLVINPETCIDCGVCEPECPADAIVADSAEGARPWLEINRKYAAVWPAIAERIDPLGDAEDWNGRPDKMPLLSDKAAEAR